MNKPINQTQIRFGFVSVREIAGLGHCGGLLVVSQIGRPLEFHCSAPVVTNRAQAILYGQTYQTFLHCEKIGLALVEKSKSQPHLLIANCAALLSINEFIETPTVVLGDPQVNEHMSDTAGLGLITQPTHFEIDDRTFWTGSSDSRQLNLIQTLAQSFTKTLSWDEPFERIYQAIEEAQTQSTSAA